MEVSLSIALYVLNPANKNSGASLPQETKDKLFITSLENIEYSILLETEARTMKWGWLFRTYVQWHAIAFLLSELCVRTKGEAVERAWRALEATAGRWWFPLGESSMYQKGKQGCLWKPLRKLMAKARAARERELALERASEVIKNGGLVYSDFPRLLENMPDPPPANQPSSENLDRMLRPAAPRLGEMPIAKPPSWAGSPVLPNVLSPPADGMDFNRTNPREHNPSNPLGNSLLNMSGYGLDFVIRDVMEDMTYDGTSIYNSNHHDVRNMNQQRAHGQHQNTSNTTMTGLEGIGGFTQSPTTFGADLNDSPAGVGSSGQSSNSPVLDNAGSMDWANWDDLVREYGMDGVPPVGNAIPNGAGHLGIGSWF